MQSPGLHPPCQCTAARQSPQNPVETEGAVIRLDMLLNVTQPMLSSTASAKSIRIPVKHLPEHQDTRETPHRASGYP